MKTPKKSPSQDTPQSTTPTSSGGTAEFHDQRSTSVSQRKLQQLLANSPKVKQLQRYQKMANTGSTTTIQRTPPSDEDWIKVNQLVARLRQAKWVKSAFPVAQGSQVALKDINSEGVCRTIVFEWLRQVKARKRTEFLDKFRTGDIDDIVLKDEEFMKQSAIRASRKAPDAPSAEKLSIARNYMTDYLSVGGSLLRHIVPNSNADTQTIIDNLNRNGFYNIAVEWETSDEERTGHGLGFIVNGDDYYFMDPNFTEIQGSASVLDYLKGILDSTYGSKKTNPTYGLLYAAGNIDEGSSCFLTTAATTAKGLPDDCDELNILRHYRDTYLRKRKGGEVAIEQYYEKAPLIVDQLSKHPNRAIIYTDIYQIILRCIDYIHCQQEEEAFDLYRQMVEALKELLID